MMDFGEKMNGENLNSNTNFILPQTCITPNYINLVLVFTWQKALKYFQVIRSVVQKKKSQTVM